MNKSSNKLARSINPGDQLRNDLRKRVHNKNDRNAELRKLKRLKNKTWTLSMLKALFYRTKTDLCPDLNPYLKPCVDLNCFNSLHESFVNLRPVTIIKPQCQQSDKVRHEENRCKQRKLFTCLVVCNSCVKTWFRQPESTPPCLYNVCAWLDIWPPCWKRHRTLTWGYLEGNCRWTVQLT